MEENEKIEGVERTETTEPGDRGAVVLQPEPPRRGTFVLLLPDTMSWDLTREGGSIRLYFRPMTRPEKREAHRERMGAEQRRELARDRAAGDTQPDATRDDEEGVR